VFALDRGTLGNLIVGPDGFLVAGCVNDQNGVCIRRILVSSPDGSTWTQRDVDVDGSLDLGSILRLVGDRLFVLAYGRHYGDEGGAVVWTSPTGDTWSRIEKPSFRSRSIRDLVESPIGTLAIGHNAPIDSDNILGFVTWPVDTDGSFGKATVVDTTNGPGLVLGAAWTGSEFLAWGYPGGWGQDGPTTVLASQDGKTWQFRAEIRGVKRGIVNAIAVRGDRLVAVGYEGRRFPLAPRAWTSDDGGRTWKQADVPSDDARIATVAVEGARFIARGSASWGTSQKVASWASNNGRTWTRIPDDQDMPAILAFSALTPVTIGGSTCTAGTYFDDLGAHRAAIYCR
jgi:photosystem II stability/assembly factor-like uncharacterized protein